MKKPSSKTKDSTPPGGLTYEEIGKNMGISKQGVRKIEKRAIKKIKRKLKVKYGYDLERVKDIFI